MNTPNDAIRTGDTTDQKEKAPEQLEAKTGRLERQLMLRQFITKALEIKRAEIAELDHPDSNILPSSVQPPPQKLTFYDVVQLARQQAFAEKTRRANEDLIDLSEDPQPSVSSSSPIQNDLAQLLDSSNPVLPQYIPPEPVVYKQAGLSELDASLDAIPAIAEMDASLTQRSAAIDPNGRVELDASGTSEIDKKDSAQLITLSDDSTQSHPPSYGHSEGPIYSTRKATEQPGLEVVDTEIAFEGGIDITGTVKVYTSPMTSDLSIMSQQSNAVLINAEDPGDQGADEKSLASSAATSIFSHSSTLTSATGCSLPSITEEDMQTRKSSLQTNSLSDAITSPPPALSLQKSATLNDGPDSNSGISSTPTTLLKRQSRLRSLETPPEDLSSLAAPKPQLQQIEEPDGEGFPWIVRAARDGDEEMVRKLLVSEVDIQATHTSTKRHALAEASIQGHSSIVNLLVEQGSLLEHADVEGNTALHHACRNGHLAVVKSLIKNGALIDLPGPEGQSALHLAMEGPHQNVVMLLLQHKADVSSRDATFRTPLHLAASQGNVAMCAYLLNEGAQLDSREAQSRTPLQLACEAGHYELSQMMLDQSRLKATNMTFLTAFFAAVEHGHVRIAESFFSQGLKLQELKRDSYKPLTKAAKSGCLAMVELMVQENCDVHAVDDKGWNALHFASYYGHYHIIERLFASGTSAKATTSRKETPLLLAVKENHFPVAERLLRRNNDSNLMKTEDDYGQQAVHHAARTGSVEIFNLLMSNAGKISVENSFGWQPLHIATAYGHLELVKGLLEQGANIEEKLGSSSIKKDQTHKIVESGFRAEARWPYPGSRPLHLACEYSHEHIASFLIGKGAKMEASCVEGWQPLHHAAYFGSSRLVETLLQGGVNPHAITNEGKNASTLGFCTTGIAIPKEETERILDLLNEAMSRVKKPKIFKVALKKASTVEDKNKLLRAAMFSMTVISRPQLHKAKTTAQFSEPASTCSELTSNAQRPRLPRHPYTSPLPMKDSAPDLAALPPSTPGLPTSQAQMEPSTPPNLPSTPDMRRKSTDTAAREASTSKATSQNITSPADTTEASPAEKQLSIGPNPKLKRRTTFGLAKVTPGFDMGKLSLGGMSKPTFDIGKQTLEIGKQTLDIGNKTLELGKQRFEIGKQGLGQHSRQGLEMGKRGVDRSKQGLAKAKKFAKKGKLGGGSKGEKRKVGALEEGKESGKAGGIEAGDNAGGDEEDEEEEEDEDVESNDDARSELSLGEFAELGNNNF